VPPSPEVTIQLINEYRRDWKVKGFSFKQFLVARGYQNPANHIHGMDDHLTGDIPSDKADLISIPRIPVTGNLKMIVLLVRT
jgi:immune inhibitor A